MTAGAAFLLTPVALVVVCGCHTSTTGPSAVSPPSGAVAQFTVSPIDSNTPGSLTALGNLDPPGHVLPSDHVYFTSAVPSVKNVYAPTRAAVAQILARTSYDWKVWFIVTPSFQFSDRRRSGRQDRL